MTARSAGTAVPASTAGTTRLSLVPDVPLEFVIRVVNEWGTLPRRAAGEQDGPYPGLAALAAEHHLELSPAIARMSDRALARVADALHPVFTAPSQDAALSALNGLLARGSQQPRLGREPDGTLAQRWAAPAGEQLLAASLLALCQQLARWGDSRRLGSCEGARCSDVYADFSPAGHRRYCSVTCQNRNRVAAFRRRRRVTAQPPSTTSPASTA